MMTAEENDLLCRVEGDAPMGQLMRRHWIPACLSEEVAEPDGTPVRVRAARRGPGGVPRHRRPARRARRALSASPRLAGASAATRNAGCAASITAGSSTWTATCSRWRPSRRRAASRRRSSTRPIRRARRAGSCGPTWARPETMPEFEPPAFGADRATTRAAIVKIQRALQLGADPRGRDRLGALLEPAFVRHGAGAGRRRQGDRQVVAAAFDRQGAAPSRSSAPATASATRRSAGRSPTPTRTTTSAPRVFVAPFTALIPPNNRYNVANMNVADG